jgi:hypothetical protein
MRSSAGIARLSSCSPFDLTGGAIWKSDWDEDGENGFELLDMVVKKQVKIRTEKGNSARQKMRIPDAASVAFQSKTIGVRADRYNVSY